MKKGIVRIDKINWLIIGDDKSRIEAVEIRYIDKDTEKEIDRIYALDSLTTNRQSGLWDIARLVVTSKFEEFKEKTEKIIGTEDFSKFWGIDTKIISLGLDAPNKNNLN